MRVTLRTKIALLTTSLVLTLVGATGAWQYSELSSEYISLMREQQQELTQVAAADLDYKLATHMAVVVRAARHADAHTLADPEAQQQFFADSDLHPMFEGLALVALDGTIVANDPPLGLPPGKTVNIGDRDYFKRVRDTLAPAISAPLMARTTHQQAILMVAPVLDATGKLMGMFGAGLPLDRPNVLGDLAHARIGQGGYYLIVTGGPAPVYVMHPDPALLLQPATLATVAGSTRSGGQAGSGPSSGPSSGAGSARPTGEEFQDLTTSARVPSTGWELRVVVPAATAYAPLLKARQALLLQLLGLGLASAVLVWLGTTWLMRPLTLLYETIRELRRAPDSPVKLDMRASDERGDLAREFDALMAELRDKRSEMAAVMDASPLGLFRSDALGRMVYVNEAYLQILGLDRADAVDGWLGLVPEAVRGKAVEEWLSVVAGAQPFYVSRWLHRRDGSRVLVVLRTQAILVDGHVNGHVGTLFDTTQRTLTEQALRTLTAIFEATTDYVVQLDTEGRLTFMNPAARQRTGVALDAPINHLSMAHFNPPQVLDRLRNEIVPTALDKGVWVGESVTWDADHQTFPVSHMVIAHRDKTGKVERFSAIMRDISAAKATEQALQRSEERLRMITDNLPVLISYLDTDLRLRFANKTYQQWFGVDPAQLIGKSLQEFYGVQVWDEVRPYFEKALAGLQVTYEREMADPAGRRRHVQATVVPERDAQGQVQGLYTLLTDITAHRKAENALRQSEARLRTMADAVPMRVAYIDATERYRFNNLAYERAYGVAREAIEGRTMRELLGDTAYAMAQPHVQAALMGQRVTFQGEMLSNDVLISYEANYIPQLSADGETVVGFHAVVTDITRQKREEHRLVQLARIDALTGMGNRGAFELRLAEAMGRSLAGRGLMALMYLDIDRFKPVNDKLGHPVGDALLKAFAARLGQTLRSTDFVARLGGDEFTVIMEDLPRPEVAATVAGKIVQAMRDPFTLGEITVRITSSIGVAFYNGGNLAADALVRQADEMLYQAKGAGRDNYQMAEMAPPDGR